MPALDEAFRIGREAKIPVEIWHLKAAGKSNWGRMPEIVARIEAARRGPAWMWRPIRTPTPPGSTRFSAIIPPWAHDGGDKKLIERLKDPATRARIRKEMETPSGDWNNEWQQVTGPESIIVGAVQNPKLLPLQGKTIAEIARIWNKDPIDTVFDLLIQDEAFTAGGALHHVRAGRGAGATAAVGLHLQRFARHRARAGFWARNIRTRARTAPFRTFCASTSARKRS